MVRHVRWAGALMVLGIGIVACGGEDGSSAVATDPPVASATASAPAAAGAPVPAALEFAAPLLGGGQFDARTYAGQPLALWFWAPY